MTDLTFPLFTYCKFIINDKIPNKDGELFKLCTNKINFKISSIEPLIIEKDWPSQEDLTKLVEALNSLQSLNSKNCDLENSQGETFDLRTTKENIRSGDLEQISFQQAGEYKHLTKHTVKMSDAASNTYTLAEGKNDEKISSSHKFQENTESSDSDAESQKYTKLCIKVSSLDGLRMYFKESVYDKYFDGAKKVDTNFIFTLNSSDKNAVSFLNKLKKLKVEECEFDHKDKKYLQSAVKEIEAQIDGLVIQVNDSNIEIVGFKDSVVLAKKKLFSLLQRHQLLDKMKNYESTAAKGKSLGKNSQIIQRNQKTSRNENSDDEKKHHEPVGSWDSGRDTHLKEPQSRKLPVTHYFPSHSSSLPVRTNYSGDSEGNKFSKDNSNYYVRNENRIFKVTILKTDITKLAVDCIVNATNKRLYHAGGVAKAIAEAAGPALKQECEAFILSGRQVAVTDIFISTGGNLPAKSVMHAVGPKWEAYDDNNKGQCIEDLRRTVIRCLVEADRQGFTSVALPSISAAIFKVPKEVCARCYMDAVKHFSTFNKEQTSLHEIFFVDVDEAMVKVIKEHFEKNWTNPCDPRNVQRDCDFANKHVYSLGVIHK